jgi:hypothetical protein
MIITVIAMGTMQSSVHQIIGVISMRYPFMATTWPVFMRASRLRSALHGVCRTH